MKIASTGGIAMARARRSILVRLNWVFSRARRLLFAGEPLRVSSLSTSEGALR